MKFDWLSFTGSLTEKMEQWSGQQMQVKVLDQGVRPVFPDESLVLGIPWRQWAWVREVDLAFNGVSWVVARTVAPLSSLVGQAARLRLLKQQALGPILFNRLKAERRDIDFRLVDKIQWSHNNLDKPLWCRRSLFHISTRPLLLKEVFLPAHPLYHQLRDNHQQDAH
ncbi:MAG: chorismate lyase [Gammaproteobacteria bacterium]|nr:chorismate lyase [Gammaproteobacteria bacterium]